MTIQPPLTFQDAVARLQAYWAACGCVVWQPNNVEVGAGTMNPATFLHVLGPEPWNVAYVEPSIRPDDARYGENPNRMGRHHQFQVILKPDPGDPQQLYLDSLAALGIPLARHDIRFVEDNWESPALGAWGLGWEVWLDGLEITQFTYFQQAGSLDLDPVSIEITYGLDRILMALQDVTHFKDLAWNDRVTFGDVLMASEVQTSRYYFELANVERLTELYNLYEAEALDALAAGLVRPGHDYVLKCSHVFNILDARGAIGVTERARYFGRMRRLARMVAEGYMAERQLAEYPLLDADSAPPWVAHGPTGDGNTAQGDTAALAPATAAPPDAPAPLLIEVGTEELPVGDLDAAMAALADRLPALLAEVRLAHGPVTVLGTPRRLVAIVADLAPRQLDHASQVVGPPVRAAYDASGKPTPTAEGFARSAGVAVAELTRVTQKGEERVAALRQELGRSATEVLRERLPALLAGMPFARTMRWNASAQSFSRPVRWLVVLHGSHVVPLEFAGLTAGHITRSSRPQGSRPLPLAAAGDYVKLMRSLNLMVDPELRRAEVARQVQAVAKTAGGKVDDDPALLGEVANLIEQPNALLGSFDVDYLALPTAVLVTVMKKHQRYFPVRAADGALLAHFVTVANGGAVDAGAVRHGNEAVLAARFADAAYFWRRDTARQLDEFTPALAGLAFQADLGSMLDKVRRLEILAPKLALRLHHSDMDAAATRRAAALAKSDLTSSMVVDFTSLQGVMGREYALRSGESAAVAEAIYEQYLPRSAGDELPATPAGIALALADRLDSLVGLFAAGLRPTGAQDPYGLRRAAVGITSILIGRELDLDLADAVGDAAAQLPMPVGTATGDEVLAFIAKRLEGLLREAGHRADAVAAVLAVQGRNPHRANLAVTALEQHVARADWGATLTAYARCARITRGQAAGDIVDGALFETATEEVLHEAILALDDTLDRADINAVLHALAALAPAINTFFDEVLVMADDVAVRTNRLALVGAVARLPERVADLSQLEGY